MPGEKELIMSDKFMLCSELAGVPPQGMPAAIRKFLADVVWGVFDGLGENPPSNEVVQDKVTDPLQWLLYGGDPSVATATYDSQPSVSNYCGKVFRSGEPTYFCK